MTNLLDRIQTDALRHAQRKPHLCHKEYKRGTSVTDKRQNDTGLFGAVCVILLFVLMLWRMMVIANNAKDLYGASGQTEE